ncbi:MAG: thiamine-binding protein [Oscillospiraceae bacterium]|nr:thiamine-binding protein [Oscillospiraceae bacterium]MCC8156160.1 thiamine-binding protein [Oscillospiraceae bacterium]MCD7768061.1 thiamine-binding protein [Oscillospiraceae bacterium]MCD7902193.1 thiamine-binding protein [Oscillospiraceae bacterium]MCD8001449.1 thiamine-binding protein [Oscillospiraceae bacterium]
MKASIAIQIEPNQQDDREAIRIVDAVIDYIRSTGLHYYVGPCETSIEGDDLHQLIDILEHCMDVAAQAGSEKVSAYVKLSYRPNGAVLTIDEKVTKHHR